MGSEAYMDSILFYSFNTMYIHILYTLNIHILCTFSGVLCTNTVYLYIIYRTILLRNSMWKIDF